MWTALRQNIEQVKRDLDISDNHFRAVSLDQWQDIEENICHHFCKLSHPKVRPCWLWEHFKQDTYSVQIQYNWPFDPLLKLVEPAEKVWLFLDETINEETKFWFYEGTINEILAVLWESSFIDEVYIASKKYEWLLCINHHDVLIATGKEMSQKLRQLEKENELPGATL